MTDILGAGDLSAGLPRRDFLKAGGMLVVGFAVAPSAFAQNPGQRTGAYEGPARLISGPSEFDRIVTGDVLVTQSTTEAFNILLPLLGALVTDSGGLLSHSAIVAREYGIPGVVGTREATERIADGVRVRVDGDAGEVTVVE